MCATIANRATFDDQQHGSYQALLSERYGCWKSSVSCSNLLSWSKWLHGRNDRWLIDFIEDTCKRVVLALSLDKSQLLRISLKSLSGEKLWSRDWKDYIVSALRALPYSYANEERRLCCMTFNLTLFIEWARLEEISPQRPKKVIYDNGEAEKTFLEDTNEARQSPTSMAAPERFTEVAIARTRKHWSKTHKSKHNVYTSPSVSRNELFQ